MVVALAAVVFTDVLMDNDDLENSNVRKCFHFVIELLRLNELIK